MTTAFRVGENRWHGDEMLIRDRAVSDLFVHGQSVADDDVDLPFWDPYFRHVGSIVLMEAQTYTSESPTLARLQHLLDTSSDWAGELGIPSFELAEADHARRILSFLPRETLDDVRIFPAEEGGIEVHRATASLTRILTVSRVGTKGTLYDAQSRRLRDYDVASDEVAAAFLGAGAA